MKGVLSLLSITSCMLGFADGGEVAALWGEKPKDDVCASQKKRGKECIKKPDCVGCMVVEENIQGDLEPISAVHGAKGGFFIDGSVLYWKADMDNLSVAERTSTSVASGGFNVQTRTQNLDFKWDVGGQLELGYIFNQRLGWKTALRGTHFNTDANYSKSISDPSLFNNLVAHWMVPLSGLILSKATARWDLKFDTLDFTLGRDFFVSKWLSFSPYFGLQGAWIEQKYRVSYDSLYFVPLSPVLSSTNKMNFRNQFKGYGFEFGSGFIFHISKNFGIVGNLQGSLIWGYCNTKQVVNGAFALAGPVLVPETVTIRDKKHRLRSSIASELGFIWETIWNDDKMRAFISTNYSYNIWFNQNEFKNGFSSASLTELGAGVQNPLTFETQTGDLQLQGLVVRAGLDF